LARLALAIPLCAAGTKFFPTCANLRHRLLSPRSAVSVDFSD
jgi:hypothetical protein